MTASGESGWRPPSRRLEWRDGVWQVGAVSPVSYPGGGNEVCLQIEADSYWFKHRNECILAALRLFPPTGPVFDIGGGNGFVALALQAAGVDAVLVEPGPGARNAARRGLRKVIGATLEDADFEAHSLAAAGAFDVLEHIPDDAAFLRRLREKMTPGGRFYCTVPAGRALWSDDDTYAGHFRRYSRASLCATLQAAGFTVQFATYFFTWLVPPVLLGRVLPSKMHLLDKGKLGTVETARSDHSLPTLLAGPVGAVHAWELRRIRAQRPLALGTSLLCVAQADRDR